LFSFFFKKPGPEEPKSAEARRCPRVNVPSEEWRVVLRSFSGVRLTPRLLNVSATGLAFQADRKQGELGRDDDRLTVEFIIPRSKTTITVTGRLAWLYKHPRDAQYRGGIRFNRMAADLQAQVVAYLEKMIEAGATVDMLGEERSA
jgi:hypothetical protein